MTKKDPQFIEGDTVEVKGVPTGSLPIEPSIPETLTEKPTKKLKKILKLLSKHLIKLVKSLLNLL